MSDYGLIKAGKAKFTWGPVVAFHEIGPYRIIEFHPQIFERCHGTGVYETERTQFHPYIERSALLGGKTK